jgi:hypothetical protein
VPVTVVGTIKNFTPWFLHQCSFRPVPDGVGDWQPCRVHRCPRTTIGPAVGSCAGKLRITLNDLGAGWFEAVLDGETYLGWNHDPDRVTMLARHSVFGEVVYIPFSKSLAGVRRDDYGRRTGSYVLYPAWCGDGEDAERTGFRRCDEK